MRLGSKIILGYVLPACLVIVLGVVNYQATERIEQQNALVVGIVMPNIQALQKIETGGLRIIAITSELI